MIWDAFVGDFLFENLSEIAFKNISSQNDAIQIKFIDFPIKSIAQCG